MEETSHFDNQELLDKKKDSLRDLLSDKNEIQNKSSKIASYNYHGFILDFYSSDSDFANSVLNFLPKEWKSVESDDPEGRLSVFLVNRWGEEWDLEVNPDCFIEKNNEIETSIQRDFIGIDLGQKVILNLDEKLGDGIFNALRWILPRRMLEKGYFLLHSSCVVDDGKAYFFLGHSGAGKSTIASLAGDRVVLGDDMNVMRISKDMVFAKAGGLGGMSFSSTDYLNEYPVAGFYWLQQDKVNQRLDLNKASGANKLLASFANLFWENMDKAQRSKLLEKASDVVGLCPFYELHFLKEEECWNHV